MMLLEHGANPNTHLGMGLNHFNMTALHAALYGRTFHTVSKYDIYSKTYIFP